MDTQQPQQMPYPDAAASQFPPPANPDAMTGVPAPQPAAPAAPYDPTAAMDPLDIVADFTGYVDRNLPPGWYLFQVEFEAGPEVKTKSGDPKVICKTKVVQAENGDTSLKGKFGPTSHFSLAGDNPFGLAALLKQGFGVELPKGKAAIPLRQYQGQAVWGRVQPQKNNDAYTEVREWRRADASMGAAPMGGLPTPGDTGIAGRI